MTGQESDMVFHFIKNLSKDSSKSQRLIFETEYYDDLPLTEIPFSEENALLTYR